MVAREFNIQSAIYPGSHIDIAPSFVIPNVTYIDNFKGAIKFFKQLDEIKQFIEEEKEYNTVVDITFIGEDYTTLESIPPVDLIISQYAGFVGQETKTFLKPGGILLCNDSHGDATLAKFDDDFDLIGTINHQNKINTKNLSTFFKRPKDKEIDLKLVRDKMKGLNYVEQAENYLFQKVK